jgi:membrane protease YdiL (CAAX protease family)
MASNGRSSRAMIEPENYRTEIESETTVTGPSRRFWGGWATFGFGVAIIVVSVVVQAIIAVIFFVLQLAPMSGTELDLFDYSEFMETIDMGLLLSLSIIISAVVCLGLIYVFIRANRGASFNEYVGFRLISVKAVIISLAVLIGYIALSALVNYVLGFSAESDVMADAYDTSVWPALFWIATVIFAPIFEEVFFRGFLFEGFRYSGMGVIGAVIVTSLVWAGFHMQYGLFQIASIFVLGIILGVVRYRTGSLWAPLAMHVFNNLLAMFLITLDVGV